MKRIIFWIMKSLFSGVCSVVILSVFCIAYNYDGIHIKTESGATDYNWESNQLKTTMKEGFSWIHMDEYGYNNLYNYNEKPDVLLLGSSHVEGVQVKEEENMGFLLNKYVSPLRVYNIGMSGHTFYRCVDNLKNAVTTYQPQKYVVMVVDAIDMSEESMLEVINNNAKPIPSYNKGLLYTLQKIPAVKVIYNQASEWVKLDRASKNNSADTNIVVETKKNNEKVLSDFLDVAVDSLNNQCKLIIAFQPPQCLDSEGNVKYTYDVEQLKHFKALCDKKNIAFFDMTSAFDELYNKKKFLAHGFSNTAVGVGHLNKYGHEAVASEIASKISEMEKNNVVQ